MDFIEPQAIYYIFIYIYIYFICIIHSPLEPLMEYGLASGVDPNTHDLTRFVVKHAGFIQSRYACTFPHVCMYVHMHACAIVSYVCMCVSYLCRYN